MADYADYYDNYEGYYDHNGTNMSYGPYEYGGYDAFVMPGFQFERPVYTLILVIVCFNILVLSVLLKRNMRNSTNLILAAIAVSDSLTGLVMFPGYLHVFSQWDDGYYILSKEWCTFYMISKFFLSRYFHTVSIWLTVFLGFQRFVCVRFPFKAKNYFTMRNTLIAIGIAFVLSPLLHVYHLVNDKAREEDGMCEWKTEQPCVESCVFLWFLAVVMHILPGILLLIFTVLMLTGLKQSRRRTNQATISTEAGSKDDGNRKKDQESRRVSTIVIAVVIVFLIPEVPYGIYLVVSLALRHADNKTALITLEGSRAFHSGYEVLLVVSFHANFWIYTFLNKRFRAGLLDNFGPLRKCIQKQLGVSTTEISSAKTVTGSSNERRSLHSEMSTGATELRSMTYR